MFDGTAKVINPPSMNPGAVISVSQIESVMAFWNMTMLPVAANPLPVIETEDPTVPEVGLIDVMTGVCE